MNLRYPMKLSRPVSLQPDTSISPGLDGLSALEIAAAVNSGKLSALSVTEAALARIAKHNPVLNSFTDVTADRARAGARAIDAAIAAGKNPGPLAGVPFAVKNLFDVQGLPTRAGSKINRELKPAPRDATLIERMEAAGAVLVGALNMGEYAYDFTGENVHDGPSRNPHDVTRMTGGSSGGSGGAVGGGLVPLALGSDTNGSIRVPSSFCGVFGLKPTYGRLSRARSFPFVSSFDHLGPFARNVGDLALAYDAMQGPDPDDVVCTTRPAEPVAAFLAQGIGEVRIAVAGGCCRPLFQEERLPGSHRGGHADRQGARCDANGRNSRSRARPCRGLCHLHLRRRVPASRSVAQAAARLRSGGARPVAGGSDDSSAAGRSRAKIPSLVPHPCTGAVQVRRCHHRA